PDAKPPSSNLKPTPDLPALPAPSDEPDLTKGQPGARLKPSPERTMVPDGLTKPPKPAPGTTGDRGKTRTTLKPPVTATDLDLRVRYRQAHSKAASDP